MELGAASSDGPPDQECSVCKDSIKDPMRLSPCGHMFCRCCLTESLKSRPHCPLCRTPASDDVILDTVRVRHSALRNRIMRPALALPVQGQFSPAPSPTVSRSIQERMNLLRQAVEAAQSTLRTSSDMVSPPSGGPPVAPTPLPRRTLLNSSARYTEVQAIPADGLGAAPQGALSPAAQTSQGGPSAPLLGGAPPPQQHRPLSPSSLSSDEDYMNDVMDDCELMQLPREGPGSGIMTYSCPYCNESGLDELDLLDHCNANHRDDRRRVVCPICTSLPHGDPNYYSRNFIGHINLRHQYYSEDFMDVRQNDSINEQAAILASCNMLVQHK
ncbi:E3 ubiquitin-protein ligase RNF138 [Megalops cyprinoides]|uniref:E3 ubiquitin-protein ligase RNF138 n=1 Tax=Megalops cyprinoides TaxID=118141 RepID=UPI001864709F|nr:E3 ubiquitin-protein ligase RNF138 [Megalops cyprinoides]